MMFNEATITPTPVGRSITRNHVRAWHLVALTAVLLLATFLNFYRLEQEGYANLYYAAAVKSMLTSWHNFFFVSFDSAGFVTVDKPPLGLWIQAASTWLLGFSGWSLLLPQALAGTLAVLLLYHLVQRSFGATAGILAALLLALSPISVAANRNNTMDSQLVLVLLLAAWALFHAVEWGKLRWLLLSLFLVGVGFNIKMLQAYLVLPAFYLLYLVAPPLSWWKKIGHLMLGTAVLLVVSLSWAVVVDLIPAGDRPFVGSSQDNTVMELIMGHNGLRRLLPGGPGGPPPGGGPPPDDQSGQPFPPGQPPVGNTQSNQPVPPGNPPPFNTQPGNLPPFISGQPSAVGGPPGGPGSSETGDQGIGRLFNQQLAGQISWFLPLAVLGFVVAFVYSGVNWPLEPKQQQMLFWAAWLLPMIVFFSMASLFHRYYLDMLAPAIAALAAVGLLTLWKMYRQPGWRGWLLPLALIGTVAVQVFILSDFPEWSRWLTPMVVIGGVGTAVFLLALRLWQISGFATLSPSLTIDNLPLTIDHFSLRFANVLFSLSLFTLLLAPAIWSYTPIWFGGDTGLPFAGPELLRERPLLGESGLPGLFGNGRPNDNDRIPGLNQELLAYLLDHYQGEQFLVAGSNARTVAPYILATNYAAMAMGGFSGSDQILTAESLAQLVSDGGVRFFLVSEQGGGPPDGPNRPGNDLTTWITANCTAVPLQLSAGPTPNTGNPRPPEPAQQLFDCQS